jgi:hypothetical protein
MPMPSSSTMTTHSAPAFSAEMVIVPPLGLLASPCRTAFSTSGCRARNGSTTDSTSGAICSLMLSRLPNRAFSSRM